MNLLLTKIIDYIDNMPVISSAPVQLVSKLSGENYDINQIVKIIEMDVSLSARCLQVVNSAAFGLRKEVTSIKQALVLLGSKTIVQVALLQGFGGTLSKKLNGYEADKKALWNHSIRTAIASRQFARKYLPQSQPDLAYTAGLLHDIGKVVTSDFLEVVDKDLSQKIINDDSKNFLEIESSLLQINHTEAGEKMAIKWNFPEILQNVIRYHHNPSAAKAEYRKLVEVVHIGDILAMMGGSGTGSDSLGYTFDEKVYQDFNLGSLDLTSLIFEIDMEFLDEMEKLDNGFSENAA